MGTIEENKETWDVKWKWKQYGDEWSTPWGGADMQWFASILPRIHSFVPTGTILEIAPGYGRWTQYLMHLCGNLIVVDLSNSCIQACKDRFAASENISYHVNDGKSLDMVPDNSIDFAFSFDSLVHVEQDVIDAYLEQLASKLTKDGVGFIHHSNIGEFLTLFDFIKRMPKGPKIAARMGIKTHWRAFSMTAAKFESMSRRAGLQCISQELINWGSNRNRLIDCISVICKQDSMWSRSIKVHKNPNYMREANNIFKISPLYGLGSFEQASIVKEPEI